MQHQSKTAGTASAVLGVMTFLVGGLVAPLVGIAGSGTAVPMGIIIVIAEIGAVVCYFGMTRASRLPVLTKQ